MWARRWNSRPSRRRFRRSSILERYVKSAAQGQLWSADTFFAGSLKGVGKVCLYAVVDTYAFGVLHVSKQPEAAVAPLHNDGLPFYRRLNLWVKAVLTDSGWEVCGTERQPYELYLDLNGIDHRCTKVRNHKTNGFVERFNTRSWRSSPMSRCMRSSTTA